MKPRARAFRLDSDATSLSAFDPILLLHYAYRTGHWTVGAVAPLGHVRRRNSAEVSAKNTEYSPARDAR